MDKMGNVQISQELFMQLLRFHLVEDESCEGEIKQGLEKKLDRMVMRDLYGKFKTAPTEEERERARKECMEVLVDDQWVRTRMEMNPAMEWYLVGTPYCGDLEYVRARIPE